MATLVVALLAALVLEATLAPCAHAGENVRHGDWTPEPGTKRLVLRTGWGQRVATRDSLGAGLSLGSDWDGNFFASGLGLDIGPHWGVELSGEYYEAPLAANSVGRFAEFSAWTFLLQGRWRQPLRRGRVVPYVTAGFGRSFGELNDASTTSLAPGAPRFDDRTQESWVYAVAIGVEHFQAPNVSGAIELKYIHNETHMAIDGVRRSLDLSCLHLSINMRCYHPGPRFDPGLRPARSGRWTPYFALRLGTLWSTEPDFHPQLDWNYEKGADAYGGASFGADGPRGLGFELAIDQYERGVGGTSAVTGERDGVLEVSTWNVVPQVRWRRPLLDGRLVPYVLGGIGLGLTQGNDGCRTPPAGVPTLRVDDVSFVATAGAGIEYFVADNIAVGVEARWVHNRPEAEIDGKRQTIDASRIVLAASLRIYVR